MSGGRNEYDEIFGTVVRYNLQTEKWENVVKLNINRWGHSSCALNDAIYVIGGRSDMGYTN